MTTERSDFPIIIENSPFEFALMGPLGRHRGVLVKSKDASLDLIGYDNPQIDIFVSHSANDINGKNSLLNLFYMMSRSSINVVRSQGAMLAGESTRKTYYNFVWKGMCEQRDLENFELAFQNTVADLNQSIGESDRSQIEWSISGLITACSLMQKRSIIRRRKIMTVIIVYIMIIFATLGVYLPHFYLKYLQQ